MVINVSFFCYLGILLRSCGYCFWVSWVPFSSHHWITSRSSERFFQVGGGSCHSHISITLGSLGIHFGSSRYHWWACVVWLGRCVCVAHYWWRWQRLWWWWQCVNHWTESYQDGVPMCWKSATPSLSVLKYWTNSTLHHFRALIVENMQHSISFGPSP